MPSGLEMPIRLPLSLPTPRQLLSIAQPIPGLVTDGTIDMTKRWLNGVSFEPWACRSLTLTAADDCSVGDEGFDAIADSCQEAILQPPFQIIDAFQASTLDWTIEDVDAMLGARFNIALSAAYAAELVAGTGSGGISLSSEAHAPAGAAFGSAAIPIWKALALLEADLATNMPGQRGIIHLTPGLLAQACSSYGLFIGETGHWETPMGNYLVADAGYSNPAAPSGQAPSTSTTDWVYLSGPVFAGVSDGLALGVGHEAMVIRRNQIKRYMSAYGVLVFDPCPVAAILTSYELDVE